MITPITPNILKERPFQTLIKEYLINQNAYAESFNDGYNAEYAIDEDKLFAFLEATQEKAMNRLKGIYKTNYRNKVLFNIDKNLRERGSIDVLKRGVKDYGVKLELAYFKPATKLNPDRYNLYKENIFSIVEELVYVKKEKKRIDLVIFLNGIPIITMELKNTFTGQTYKKAIKQYKQDRNNKEKIFKFKERAIVNFAMDTEEAYITTKLDGENTIFLPFNKGNNESAGNPIVDGKLKTHYIWEEVLQKDSLLEIIHKFTYIEKKEKETDNRQTYIKETVIFPRYHQLDVVRKVINHAKNNGAGHKYLIQHSAGSGKTNSITWIAHRLASLHDNEDNIIFNGIIVVTDRKVLDAQLQESIYQIEHKDGLVAKIDESSSQLAKELELGTKIIISTIQKFPYILDKLAGTKGKKYAIVIDEAHSSTSGRNIMALKESLSREEALIEAAKEDVGEKDAEDKINEQLKKFVDTSNVSFFAFTATPKGTTLRLFGDKLSDDKYYPFHIYSMRQAIEEGFILDVLKNYMTYKMYYNVNKKIEEDPKFDKSRAAKSIIRYVSLHPHNILQKTEIIIEHFRNHTMKRIGGHAKAMLVTASRLHAVRYKLAFDEYIKRKGYTDLKTLVAFSGTVKDSELDFTERGMNNGVADTRLKKEFDKDEYRVLIVANKYQTGYDQPKLHTMYVDKKLKGVKAVQTLSRLNRIAPGKEDTFVMDFVNEPEEILEAFAPFYRTTVLESDIEPNEVYTIERAIYEKRVISKDDVKLFTDRYYKDKHTSTDASIMNNCVDNSIARMRDFTREETIDFRNLIKQFISIYNLIIQIAPVVDTDLHRLNVYLRFLVKKIDIESPSGVDITDKVLLEYYKLEKKTEGELALDESTGVNISIGGAGTVAETEKDLLSTIIETLNERYGTDFSNSEKLAVEQIRSSLRSNDELELKAKNNAYNDFKYAFEKTFDDNIAQEFEKNQKFYGKILKDEGFRSKLMDLIMFDVYESFRAKTKGAGEWDVRLPKDSNES